jgi:cytochrome c oxidase assembly protein subunit 15
MHLFARLTAGAALALIFTGGLVTSTGSGLAVPDWPLSFGQFFPEMVGGVLYEHGHRMVAGGVALLTLALALWIWRRDERPAPRRLAAVAVAAVVVQAVLGGVTVLMRLPLAVSVSHACLGQSYFCILVALAVVAGPDWRHAAAQPEPAGPPGLFFLAVLCAGAVFVQLVIGATVRHLGAGLAIPDFPLAFGRWVPSQWDAGILVQYLHRLWALVVAALVLWPVARVEARHAGEPGLQRPARLLALLLAAQVTFGALTVWTGRAVLPTTAHVATGAALLATAMTLAMRSRRLLAPRAAGIERDRSRRAA